MMQGLTNFFPTLTLQIMWGACGNDAGTEYTDTHNYLLGDLKTFELSGFYSYTNSIIPDKENTCANVAGVIMLNYWNKYYNNDILKESRRDSLGNLNYSAASDYANIFYNYMCTNHWGFLWLLKGTGPKECAVGFQRLIQEKGYKCQYESYTTENSATQYFRVIQFLESGKPIK